jgi:hypothetical protein
VAGCLNKRDIKSGVKFDKGNPDLSGAVYWSETETLVKRGGRPLKSVIIYMCYKLQVKLKNGNKYKRYKFSKCN